MSSTRTWDHAIQETVRANGYVPLPEPVRGVVETDHPLEGPSVFWNYDRNARYVVLSERSLDGAANVDVGRYRVYDPDGDAPRVRPPDALDEVVRSKFAEGSRVVYLAYEAMTGGDNGSVYLLSTGQLLSLLPDRAAPESRAAADGERLREAVLQAPGLLPSP